MEPWAKETGIAIATVVGILLILTAYTGVWPPLVVVESGSMMHPQDHGFGRLGVIDPGDLVLVKHVAAPRDVHLNVQGDHATYGKAGDVVIYHPDGDPRRTPIIHRAMTYVQVSGGSCTWVDPSGQQASCNGGITVDAWGLHGYHPQHSGFITKGDNNGIADQAASIQIVRFKWVEGVARGEIPWVGLIKLALGNHINEPNAPASWVRIGNAYAPGDLWFMLAVTLAVVFVVPVALENGYRAWRRQQDEGGGRDPPPPPPPPATHREPEEPPREPPWGP